MPPSLIPPASVAAADDGLTAQAAVRKANDSNADHNKNQFKRRRRKGRTRTRAQVRLDYIAGENELPIRELCARQICRQRCSSGLEEDLCQADCDEQVSPVELRECPSRIINQVGGDYCFVEKRENYFLNGTHTNITPHRRSILPHSNNVNNDSNRSQELARFLYDNENYRFSYSDPKKIRCFLNRKNRENFNISINNIVKFLALIIIIVAYHCMFIVCSQASFVQSSSSDINYDAKYSSSEPPAQSPLAPQPLIYRSFEFGSGDSSYSPYSSSPSTSSSISSDQSYSSVSPALIEAKCWNNYADDNDCKHLNVITAPNGGGQQQQQQQQQQQYSSNEDTSSISSATDAAEDDSIITPVVIFESTSPMNELYSYGYESNLNHEDNRDFNKMASRYGHSEDDNQRFQPAQVNLAPPYSPSASTEPSSRHHQHQNNYHHSRFRPSNPSTTANDVYSAPSATATVLPDPSMIDESGDDRSDDNNNNNLPDEDSQQQPVTKPTAEAGGSGVFVGTPRPKFKLKTTTSGRKCRDDSDADCDEPEDVEDDNDNGDRPSNEKTNNNNNSNNNGNNNRIVWKFNSKTLIDNGMGRGSTNDNNAVGSTTDTEDGDDDDENKATNGENGSGDGSLVDDNEDGIDDDTDGSSGNGSTPEVPLSTVTSESFFSTTTASDTYGLSTDMPFNNRSRNHDRQSTTTTTTEAPMTPVTPLLIIPTLPSTTPSAEDGYRRGQTNAEIEVIVHSTLPPSFPITTQPTRQESDFQTEDALTTMSNSISTLPDDTVTSKPIFPSPTSKSKSGEGDASGNNGGTADDNNINDNDADQSAGPTTTMDSDLDTFKPIPMQEQWPERSPSYPFAKNGSNSDGNDGDSSEQQGQAMSQRGSNDIPNRFKFEPLPAGGKFNDLWQHPTRAPINPINNNEPAPNTEQSSNDLSGKHRSSASTSELASSTSPNRAPDVLPTMILYAAIIIIATTALIFVTTAFIYYWRSNARRQALLHKTNLMNGAANPQISPFMSHPIGPVGGPGMPPAPMMAAMAQPGSLMAPGGAPQMHPGMVGPTHEPVLLSTYAPGKGVNGGRVTTGLVRQDMGTNIVIEEDGEQNNDEDGSIMTVNNNNNNSTNNNNNNNNNNNSSNNNLDNEHVTTATKHDANAVGDNYCMQTRNRSGPQHQSSWSTNEESGGGGGSASASGTGVSSGSRTESDSQQAQEGLMPPPPPPQTGVMINGQQQQPPYGPVPHHQEQQHHQQQPQQHYPMRSNFNNSLSDERQNCSSISDSQCSQIDNQHPMRPMQPLSQEQQTILPPDGYDPNRQQYNGPPDYSPNPGAYPPPNCGPIQMMMPPKGGLMSHSRSIEDLRQQQMQPGLVRTPQPYFPHLNRQQTMPSPRQQHHLQLQYPPAGAALFKQQQLLSLTNSSCSSTPTQILQQRAVYFPSPSERFSSNYSIGEASQNGFRGPPSSTMGPAGILGPQSPPMSISPRRVAMNPLATLGKRGLMRGGGLNRNIYSEDSSSLLTTSPSLVRTSSSSSFAFNTSQTGSIRAKPLLDASGHIINDYTQSYSNHVNGSKAPPVFGRKGRSDAWYV